MMVLIWENQQIQARVMQEQQEIFVHNILKQMTSENLPKKYVSRTGNALLQSLVFICIE
jgi:hypothetical protein